MRRRMKRWCQVWFAGVVSVALAGAGCGDDAPGGSGGAGAAGRAGAGGGGAGSGGAGRGGAGAGGAGVGGAGVGGAGAGGAGAGGAGAGGAGAGGAGAGGAGAGGAGAGGAGAGGAGSGITVPELGAEGTRRLTTISTPQDGLATPRALAFHPDRPDELWTWNRATDGTVIYFAPGTRSQRVDARVDAYGDHFMEEVSGAAFGAANTFATCHESRNTYNNTRPPNDFMGPALWPADLAIYARVHQNDQLLGSHLDMLHGSPMCMGIAHLQGNQYFVFDGDAGSLTFYDFQRDHGPGYEDHSDGIIRRYPEVRLTRKANVPGHMVVDADRAWLYIADTGAARVVRFDVRTGARSRTLPLVSEPLAEYSEMMGATTEVFASQGLREPSGLALANGRLFVSDHASGEIIAFEVASKRELARVATGAQGLMGLTFGPDGKLYYVDAAANAVVRVDP